MRICANVIKISILITSFFLILINIQPVSGFSTVGNFFETEDITCWMTFNDDYSDKSTNNYPVTPAVTPVTYTSTLCYDEKAVVFPNQGGSQYQHFDFNSQSAKSDLNLNDVDENCHMRISMWIDADDGYGSTSPGTMALASKYVDNYPQYYRGWELELEDINNGAGRLRFKIDNTVNPNILYDMVDLNPTFHFNQNRNLFYDKTFVVAGWDFDPYPEPHGILWLKAIIKTDPSTFTVYRNFVVIGNLPSSTNVAMRVGEHSGIRGGWSPGKYVGIMDEFSISKGHTDGDFMGGGVWEENIHSLPHENQIAYYNFENIETKNSVTYDEEVDMFFDGSHVVPHNGKIVDDNYVGAPSSSWDGSDCLALDGTNYGQIKKNIDGWGESGGNFALTGWPQSGFYPDQIIKEIEVGCIFRKEGNSEDDQVLMSKFGSYVWLYGSYDYGYKIGIDSNNKLFADLAINLSNTRTSVNSYTIQLDTWYKCLLSIDKYEIDDTYYIDAEITIWEYSGGSWVQRGTNSFSYSHPKWHDGLLWRINDINDWTIGSADPIIGGTWDTNLNNVVVDKFEGKIDDAKWYKSLAFDVRGYNKYTERDA